MRCWTGMPRIQPRWRQWAPTFCGVPQPGGGAIIDIVGKQPCANNGNVTAGMGPNGPAVTLASGTYLSVPNNPAWSLTGDWTLRARLTWTASPSANWWQDAIMGHDNGTGVGINKWIFSYDPTRAGGGATTFHINGSTSMQIWSNNWTPVLGTFYDVAVAYQRSTNQYTFFLNGVANGTTINSTAMHVATTPLTIGTAEGGATFQGQFSLAQIWSYRALSAAEIAVSAADPLWFCRPERPWWMDAGGGIIGPVIGSRVIGSPFIHARRRRTA